MTGRRARFRLKASVSAPLAESVDVPEPARRSRLGLRARVVAAFTLGALLLSVFLSFSTYVVVRHTLVEQREQLAEQQTYFNARGVKVALRSARTDIPKLLAPLGTRTDSDTALISNGKWYPGNIRVAQQDSIPASLRERVQSGQPARMRFQTRDGMRLAVGIPMPEVNASYFEISKLTELNKTLQTIELTLIVASIVTTLGGVALGWWATRLVLRPVTQAASAAETIAGGDMSARLEPDGDTDLDRLVLSFNRMVDALQSRIERDARFASDVSHELRSPLMTLASGLSVLQSRRHELPQRSQMALDLLADEVVRFQRMVQDLLEISRTDAGHVDAVFEEVLLGEFVSHVVRAYEREIPIEADTGVSDVVLSLDKRRMERVIGNLIENADRYAGGVVRIGLHWAGKNVRIVVDDAGPGVPMEERERIFERFARGATAKARASGEGTGLGLSLVDEHVQLHRGRVWVEDRPGGGSRFVVEIPRADR